jgi:sugar phosphate permease
MISRRLKAHSKEFMKRTITISRKSVITAFRGHDSPYNNVYRAASLKDQRESPKAFLILACAMVFYLYEYVLRVSPSVMIEGLMRDFSVTSSALGVLASFYYFSYVALQIPCGVIVDAWGPRKVITVSAFLCTVGTYIFSMSESLGFAQLGRFLIGAGSSCAYLSCMKIGSVWFKPNRFAIISGVGMMMGVLGGTFGGQPLALLVNASGWRGAMFHSATVGVVITLLSWIIIRDKPQHMRDEAVNNKHTVNTDKFLDGLKLIAKRPQNWFVGLYGCMLFLPLSAFAELWSIPYLMQKYSITNDQAAQISVLLFLGMAVGSPLGAWISNRLKSRKKVMAGTAFFTFLFFMLILYIPDLSITNMRILQFLAGLACGGQVVYFAAAQEYNPAEISGTSIGFTNFFVMISGVIFQPALGYVLDAVWEGNYKSDGTPLYTGSDYQMALTLVAMGLLFAIFVLFFVKETYAYQEKKPVK